MIKLYNLLILMLSFGIYLGAQTQVANSGFEEWEPIEHGSVPEPVDWSAARTALPDELAALAPANWGQSDDAHSGNYSVYVINKSAFGIVATGTITCGRVYADLDPEKGNVFTDTADERWHASLPHRPDSVIGWYKAKPSAGDFPTVKFLLHKGFASVPQDDSASWIGVAHLDLPAAEVTEWTRFSIPFVYESEETPEFCLAVLTAGDGLNSIADSEAWFDDLQLIYNAASVQELEDDNLIVSFDNDLLNVQINHRELDGATLVVSDLMGRQLYSESITAYTKQRIRLSESYGMVVVTIRSQMGNLSRKVMVR
jgi:hypothetical protein